MKTKCRITATLERDGQILDASQPEICGTDTYDTRVEAQDMIDDYRYDAEHGISDLDPAVEFSIESFAAEEEADPQNTMQRLTPPVEITMRRMRDDTLVTATAHWSQPPDDDHSTPWIESWTVYGDDGARLEIDSDEDEMIGVKLDAELGLRLRA